MAAPSEPAERPSHGLHGLLAARSPEALIPPADGRQIAPRRIPASYFYTVDLLLLALATAFIWTGDQPMTLGAWLFCAVAIFFGGILSVYAAVRG